MDAHRLVTHVAAQTLITVALLIGALTAQAHAAPFAGKVKIAAVQTSPVFGDKAANLADMRSRALAAGAAGADLIVFPELSLTGYKYRTRAEMAVDAEAVPGPSTQAMAAVAKEANAYIAFGMVESDGDGLYDAVVLVGPEGYVGKYEKITMGHQSEAVLFTRGPSAPPVFDTSIGRIGLASCYDGAFPENARLLGLGGAQIMVLIDTENGTTWRDYVRTRAVENGAYAVVANRIGTERNSTFNGYSLIAAPDFSLLANASTNAVETISATVDLGDLDRTFITQRRPELYRAMTQPMDPQLLGVNADPQSSVAATGTHVDVSFATTAIAPGTPTTARLVDGSGATIAQASGTLGVDQGVLSLDVPAGAPVGVQTLKVQVAGQEKTLPFTVKDVAKPAVLGTVPDSNASAASTIYVGFDSALVPSANVPMTLAGAGQTFALHGAVNQSVIDNRVTASYSGLVAGATYTVSIPAGAVTGATTGQGNDATSFSFTVAPTATTVVGAVAQNAITPLDKTANVASTITQMTAAAGQGVKLLVFPELNLTGAQFADRAAAQGVAEGLDGPAVAAIAAKAAELGMTVVVGLVESDAGKLYDTSVLIGPAGVIGSHRSTQLRDDQVGIFDEGNTVSPVFDTVAGKLGLISGYEDYFPEVARSLAVRGALVVAGGFDEPGTIWRELVRTRGSENKIYVLAANQPAAGGKSLIASTSRAINAEMTDASIGFVKTTLNLTTIANRYYTYVDQSTDKSRTTHYYLDRRPEIYAPISVKSPSTTALALDRSAATVGGADLVATASVTGTEDAVLGGRVVFSDGGAELGETVLAGGVATLTIPTARLGAGQHTLTATYVGNDDLAESSARAAVVIYPLTDATATPAATPAAAPSADPVPATVTPVRARVTPTLSVKLARRAVRRGATLGATVTVSAPGLAAPDGMVTVRAAGRTVRVDVRDGVAHVRIPAFPRRTGARKMRATLTFAFAQTGELNAVTKRMTVTVRS